jgi:hypothetical protein
VAEIVDVKVQFPHSDVLKRKMQGALLSQVTHFSFGGKRFCKPVMAFCTVAGMETVMACGSCKDYHPDE